jgi:hypothetical protein
VCPSRMSENLMKLIMATLEKRIFRELLEIVRVSEDNCDIMHLIAFWNVKISGKNAFTNIIIIVICSMFHRLRREFNRKIYARVYHVRKFGKKCPVWIYNDLIRYQRHSIVRYCRRSNRAQLSITMRRSQLRTPIIMYPHNLTFA